MNKLIHYVDKDMIELATKYSARKADEINYLLKNIESIKVEELQSFGHKLKGTAGSFNLNYLGDIGKKIEISDDKKAIRILLDEARACLLNVEFKSN